MGTDASEEIHKIGLSAEKRKNVDQDDKDYPHDHEDHEEKFRNAYLGTEKSQQNKGARGNGADGKNDGAYTGQVPPENSVCSLTNFTAFKELVGKTQNSRGD
jgi:hypothetical protein